MFSEIWQKGEMNSDHQTDCCGCIFEGFEFQDLKDVNPPDEKGVYAVRVKKKGCPVDKIVEQTGKITEKLGWKFVGSYINRRIERLKDIDKYPIIYIGSAGTHKTSQNTLKKRYEEFSGRHTVMYPIWALIYFDWQLEFGWKIEKSDPKKLRII